MPRIYYDYETYHSDAKEHGTIGELDKIEEATRRGYLLVAVVPYFYFNGSVGSIADGVLHYYRRSEVVE